MKMYLLLSFVFLLPFMVSIAFLTLLERKVLGLIGLRLGPNKVSTSGFLQPLGDAFKLFNKQEAITSSISMMLFHMSCFFSLFACFLMWSVSPLEPQLLGVSSTFLILMCLLSVNAVAAVLCGWSSFSKYSIIGCLRAATQLVSYEGPLYLVFFFFFFFFESFSIYFSVSNTIGFWFFLALSYFWFPCVMAELNRSPLDFSEGESELVSGFNVEYGSHPFIFIFLSEYGFIVFFSSLTSFLFFPVYFFFFLMALFYFIWVRSCLPRFRYDKLMHVCWKVYLPVLTLYFLFCLSC